MHSQTPAEYLKNIGSQDSRISVAIQIPRFNPSLPTTIRNLYEADYFWSCVLRTQKSNGKQRNMRYTVLP